MVDELRNIHTLCPAEGTLIGLDVGKKTLGVAISSPDRSFALPLETIRRTKFMKDMEALSVLVRDHEAVGFVVGLPMQMDGDEGRRAQSVRDFAAELQRYFDGRWVALWDERLSTVSVEDFVDEVVEKRKTRVNAKASGLIDKLAAQHILEGALGFLRLG